MSTMLLIILFAVVTCQVITTEGFLAGCPVDKEQRIGDDSVMDILETFYNDLIFVRACTESQQKRRYSNLVGEISDMTTDRASGTASTLKAYRLFSELLIALQENRFETADRLINASGGEYFIRDWVENYFYYFQAEVKRLRGEIDEAAKAAMWSFLERKKSAGISMNRLERLEGVLALQKVTQFNIGIDRIYGLRKSPDYQLLRIVHFMFKDETVPLRQISLAIFDKLFRESPEMMLGSPALSNTSFVGHDVERSDNIWEDFGGQSVARTTVENILCEFAQKLYIVVEDESLAKHDFSKVLDELRRLDTKLANEFEVRVLQYIDIDIGQARSAVTSMWREYHSPPYELENTKGIFLAYFHIELNFLQSEYGCNVWELDALHFAYEFILKDLRTHTEGLSLGMLTKLEAKIVLHWLKCYRERVKLAYELDDNENEQQLQAKYTLLGASCDRILPDSHLLKWNPADD